MNFSLNRILRVLIPIVLVGIVGNTLFVIYTSEDNLWDSLAKFSPLLFGLAVILAVVSWFGHALRTVIWSKFLGHPLSFKNGLRIALAHDLGGAVTPTVIGGTPVKLGLLMANRVPAGSAGMIVLLQVMEDLVFLLTSLPLSLYFAGGLDNPAVHNLKDLVGDITGHLWWIIPALVLFTLLVRLLYKKQKSKVKDNKPLGFWQGIKSRFLRAWLDFRSAGQLILERGKLNFLLTAFMMYIEWSSRFAIPVVLAFALGIEANPFQLFFLHWIVWFTMLVIPTPGATGGAEATFYFLFIPFIPESLIGILITGWRFLSYYFVMLISATILQIIGVMDNK